MAREDLSELYDTIQRDLATARYKHEALDAAFDDLGARADELERKVEQYVPRSLLDDTRAELEALRKRIKAALLE